MDSQETEVPRKKRGPAPTGKGQQVKLSLHNDLLAPLDAWIAEQPEPMTRQQAIYAILRRWVAKKS